MDEMKEKINNAMEKSEKKKREEDKGKRG